MIQNRIRLLFFASCIIVFIIIGRLFYVQVLQGEILTSKAESSWLRDIPFRGERGIILDRNGEVLTENITAFSVFIVPKQVKDQEKVAKELSEILNISYEKMHKLVTKKATNVEVHPEGRKITEKQANKIRGLHLDGVYLAKDSKRHYPYDKYLSHVLGFTGIDNQGLMGLELQHNDELSGENGSLSFYADAKGNRMADKPYKYTPPTNGNDLKTTIDLTVQTIIERELTNVTEKYHPDQVSAIAVDPTNGAILGMASRPNFSPNNYQAVDSDIFGRNVPIWSTFEPGSTFKIITLAAALENNLIDMKKDTYYDKGHIEVGGAKLRCWKAGGHGSQSLLEVAENSCNPGFVHIGEKVGKKQLFSFIRKFGFGSKTGIDLQGEGTGILFKDEQVGPVELATTSFGQGVSVTPIQQVMALAAVVNGGYLYTPYIVDEWIDSETNQTMKKTKPEIKRRVISESTSKQMRDILESVVANGTGRPAYIDGYRVGGKTGTAQKVGPDGRYMKNNYILSFIGFAPADDPKIVVYVAIDNPKDVVQFGGVVAAPVVKAIIEDSLRNLNIPVRKGGLEKEYQWPEQPKKAVPNLIGLEKNEMLQYLSPFNIEVHGKGEIIADQSPKAGTKLEEGATIRLYLTSKKFRENE